MKLETGNFFATYTGLPSSWIGGREGREGLQRASLEPQRAELHDAEDLREEVGGHVGEVLEQAGRRLGQDVQDALQDMFQVLCNDGMKIRR